MNKRVALYSKHNNPKRDGVKFVSIQTETDPPYVFCTDFLLYPKTIEQQKRHSDLEVIPIELAMKKYRFKQGDISSVKL
jgi:hypothetical protein